MKVEVDSMSPDGTYIYFWYDGLDGDAIVKDGHVIDAQVNHQGVDLTEGAEREIKQELQEWLSKNSS